MDRLDKILIFGHIFVDSYSSELQSNQKTILPKTSYRFAMFCHLEYLETYQSLNFSNDFERSAEKIFSSQDWQQYTNVA